MKLSIYCKASTQIGLGHLIRSFSFAKQIYSRSSDLVIYFNLIGETSLIKLAQHSSIHIQTYELESQITDAPVTDLLILDMVEIGEELLGILLKKSTRSVVLSPIFNHFGKVDYYFGRTKYLNFDRLDYPNLKVYAGLEYAIIQENCVPIGAGVFEENLRSKHFPIGIIMGGGDATNKTLKVLQGLKKCNVQATFWVMVGEGYKYSLDELSDEIRRDTTHEIILAKTNINMWRILNNCVLCILPGGITSFEAVYAGLPTINFFEEQSQEFLIKEITEHNAAYNFGVYTPETMQKISAFVEELYNNRKQLLQMHVNTKALIDNRGCERILEELSR